MVKSALMGPGNCHEEKQLELGLEGLKGAFKIAGKGAFISGRQTSRGNGMVFTLFFIQISLHVEGKSWVLISGLKMKGQTHEPST